MGVMYRLLYMNLLVTTNQISIIGHTKNKETGIQNITLRKFTKSQGIRVWDRKEHRRATKTKQLNGNKYMPISNYFK